MKLNPKKSILTFFSKELLQTFAGEGDTRLTNWNTCKKIRSQAGDRVKYLKFSSAEDKETFQDRKSYQEKLTLATSVVINN